MHTQNGPAYKTLSVVHGIDKKSKTIDYSGGWPSSAAAAAGGGEQRPMRQTGSRQKTSAGRARVSGARRLHSTDDDDDQLLRHGINGWALNERRPKRPRCVTPLLLRRSTTELAEPVAELLSPPIVTIKRTVRYRPRRFVCLMCVAPHGSLWKIPVWRILLLLKKR